MNPVKMTGDFFDGLLDRLISFGGALAAMQIPGFISHYAQRLGGHVDELARMVARFTSDAAASGRTLDSFVALHLDSEVKEFRATGRMMQDTIERYQDLTEALKSLLDSAGLERFFVFLGSLRGDIFSAAMKQYTFQVPLTMDALWYGLAGFILFFLLYRGLRYIVMLPFRGKNS